MKFVGKKFDVKKLFVTFGIAFSFFIAGPVGQVGQAYAGGTTLRAVYIPTSTAEEENEEADTESHTHVQNSTQSTENSGGAVNLLATGATNSSSAEAEAKSEAKTKTESETQNTALTTSDGRTLVSLGTFRLTGYCPCYSCSEGYGTLTSTGARATAGRTIAVDPRIIPYGSHVLINGHEYIAEDRGGAIKNKRIDIYFNSHAEASNVLQYAEVYLIQDYAIS